MPNTSTVSVILPTYNRAWSLSDAIESVMAQSHPHVELIVVDDGSTDKTTALLDCYGDRLTVLRQPNHGVSAARNRGIEAARGKLIALIDSDDCWMPEKLAIQVDFFRRHPTAMICQSNEIWIRNGRRVNPGKRHAKPSGMIFEPSLALCLVSPSAVMMRRVLFDRVGFFDERLPACEDYDLWLRVSQRYPVHLIDQPLVIKRGGHEDQLSRAPGLDRYRIAALQKILDSGRLNPVQYRAAADMLVVKSHIYANGCLRRGRQTEAAHYFALIKRFEIES